MHLEGCSKQNLLSSLILSSMIREVMLLKTQMKDSQEKLSHGISNSREISRSQKNCRCRERSQNESSLKQDHRVSHGFNKLQTKSSTEGTMQVEVQRVLRTITQGLGRSGEQGRLNIQAIVRTKL